MNVKLVYSLMALSGLGLATPAVVAKKQVGGGYAGQIQTAPGGPMQQPPFFGEQGGMGMVGPMTRPAPLMVIDQGEIFVLEGDTLFKIDRGSLTIKKTLRLPVPGMGRMRPRGVTIPPGGGNLGVGQLPAPGPDQGNDVPIAPPGG